MNENNDYQREFIHKWHYLIDYNIVTEEELLFLHSMYGLNVERLQDMLYQRTGYHTFNDHIKANSKGQIT